MKLLKFLLRQEKGFKSIWNGKIFIKTGVFFIFPPPACGIATQVADSE